MAGNILTAANVCVLMPSGGLSGGSGLYGDAWNYIQLFDNKWYQVFKI